MKSDQRGKEPEAKAVKRRRRREPERPISRRVPITHTSQSLRYKGDIEVTLRANREGTNADIMVFYGPLNHLCETRRGLAEPTEALQIMKINALISLSI